MTVTIPVESAHGAECGCQRCRGFEPGNTVASTHGAYSPIRLQPRARSIRDGLEPLVPLLSPSDGPILDLLSMTLAHAERAGMVLAYEQAQAQQAIERGERPPERLDRLATDTRAWINTCARLLDQLGMTPTSRARLGLDIVRTEDTLVALAAAGAEIRARRMIGVDGE